MFLTIYFRCRDLLVVWIISKVVLFLKDDRTSVFLFFFKFFFSVVHLQYWTCNTKGVLCLHCRRHHCYHKTMHKKHWEFCKWRIQYQLHGKCPTSTEPISCIWAKSGRNQILIFIVTIKSMATFILSRSTDYGRGQSDSVFSLQTPLFTIHRSNNKDTPCRSLVTLYLNFPSE